MILHNLSMSQINRLQNHAELFRLRCRHWPQAINSINPILKSLHWLSISESIFKLSFSHVYEILIMSALKAHADMLLTVTNTNILLASSFFLSEYKSDRVETLRRCSQWFHFAEYYFFSGNLKVNNYSRSKRNTFSTY